MAQLINPFNAKDYNPEQGAGQLPIGKHLVVIESSEVKANKANDGGYLQLNLRVIDGPNAGLTGPHRLNLYHNSQETCDIANRQLSAICHVVHVYDVTDSSALHNIPFIVEVTPQKNEAKYTQVSKVFDINGNEPGKAPAGQAQPQQQQQQAAAPANNGQWGGQQQQAPANTGAPANAGWGQPQQPQPEPNAAPQNTGGAWGAPAGGQQPAWGQGQQAPANNGGGAWNQNAGGAPAATGNAPWGAK